MNERSRAKVRLLQTGFGFGLVVLWELMVRFGVADPFFFSRPTLILQRTYQWFVSGSIYQHLLVTVIEAVLAFVVGSALGILVGFWLARSPLASATLDPYIRAANSLPRVVLAPIFILWFGLGIASKVALGVTLVFFIVFFNTFQGVREVDPVVLNNARMLGASERQLWQHVLVPSAMTWVFSSLHTSIGFALVGAVVGEYMGSARGLGYIIAQAEGTFDSTGVFAGMVVLAAVVLLIDAEIHAVENRLLKWKPQQTVLDPQTQL